LSQVVKIALRGVWFWFVLMLVITACWYLVVELSIFPGISPETAFTETRRLDFALLAAATLLFGIWIAFINTQRESAQAASLQLADEVEGLQKKLQQGEAELDEQYQMMPVAALKLDGNLVIQRCNHAFLNLMGFERSSIAGQPLSSFLAGNKQEKWPALAASILNDSVYSPLKIELVRQVGDQQQPFWVQLNKRIKFGADDARQIFITLTDISERINAENFLQDAYQLLEQQIVSRTSELYEANERMSLAANSAQMGVWDLDLKSGQLIWDEWMYRLHGITHDRFPHTVNGWQELVYEADRLSVTRAWSSAVRERTNFEAEFRVQNQLGETRWIKANATSKKDRDGVPERMIGVCRDITLQKENENIIRQQADYDDLTGLPNRKLFRELLNQEIKEGKRDNYQIWLLFLDLDGFKEVNDTLGHHVGDLLLQKVAERLQTLLRSADIVARLGGDEFVIILTDISDSSTVDRICQMVIETTGNVYRINSEEVFVTTSIGIANFPNDADNTADLLKFADQAMYASKEEGKNTFTYFTKALQSASLLRKEILHDLRTGIAENHFHLFFQPIVNLATGEFTKAEALLRWSHPEKGVISPAAFIPIAEETGVIKEIGFWIFENAFAQLQSWRALLPDGFQLSINMSPVQLKSTDENIDGWFKLLNKYGLQGSNIVIEITEGMLLRNDDVVNQRLLRYSENGVQVAIDDFGTGYSSLAYLKEFDIDYLKIDQTFTQKISEDSNEKALSHAIIVMAQQLGLKVIAEGIETPEQRDFLRDMGCDFGQGYLFSRPLPAEEFIKFLSD
jgi:diguanylate cyclase (GGDEF)-like protein/PAS domain S-box-containing protein